jgi:hypothetical protein
MIQSTVAATVKERYAAPFVLDEALTARLDDQGCGSYW